MLQHSPVALALRQETQLIEANHQRVRPPRELAWALAMFVYSLQPPPERPVADRVIVARGEALFDAGCRRCHDNAVGGGDPIPAALVGTDPALADGEARGTGMYRPPALLDLEHAAPLLHHGALASVHDLLSADRLRPDYVGVRGVGAVMGHLYGTTLSDSDRAALETYLLDR